MLVDYALNVLSKDSSRLANSDPNPNFNTKLNCWVST